MIKTLVLTDRTTSSQYQSAIDESQWAKGPIVIEIEGGHGWLATDQTLNDSVHVTEL